MPYGEIVDVDARDSLLELRVTIATAGDRIVVDTSKRGIGSGREFVERLRRRIAA